MKKSLFKTALAGAGVLLAMSAAVPAAHAEDTVDPYAAYRDALKGKRVGFVPISMGTDIVQAFHSVMQRDAKDMGYDIVVRDPNWNIESGIQAINSLIAEKPDLLVVMNNDTRSYNRVLRRALQEGIPTIQIQQNSETPTDAFIGTDFIRVGAQTAERLVAKCGSGSGTSGNIALIQGSLTGSASTINLAGMESVFKEHPEIRIVASQAVDWDATKAYSVTSTILKQHPDLCGIAGFWDVEDVGTASAIREAGLQGKVFLVTSGGGKQDSGCDKLISGDFSEYIIYDSAGAARDLVNAMKMLLQTKAKPGSAPISLLSPGVLTRKDTVTAASCWTQKRLDDSGY